MVICNICSVSVSKKNLGRHMKLIHEKHTESNHRCLQCNQSFYNVVVLRSHLEAAHGITPIIEKMKFSSKSKFEEWLDTFHSEQSSQYAAQRTTKRANERITYYLCSRSGMPSKASKNLRAGKTQGSKKIGHSCTSQIILKEVMDAEECTVTFFKTHYGHSEQLQHLHLPKSVRREIANKLACGVPVTRILDSFRSTVTGDLKRADLLTRQDIYNVASAFKISVSSGVRHHNDVVSVDLWVEECKTLKENNPILFYKKQGECHDPLKSDDFLLVIMNKSQKEMYNKFGNEIICIDSTHGLNNYNFNLTTLLVVDDFGEGFPVCFMFSNKEDSVILSFLFSVIKNHAGIVMPRTFMSDMCNTFYNAWENVMGAVEHQLYCSWHVARAFKVNLVKIKGSEKRGMAWRELKKLRRTKNINRFHSYLKLFMDMLEKDPDTHEYYLYFKNYYLHNYQKWAYCYRKGCGINTNMRIENVHKVLKYDYLGGRKVKRLDSAIHTVMYYIRDKTFDRIIKLTKGKPTVYRKEMTSRHLRGLGENVVVQEIEKNKRFLVLSENKEYLVIAATDDHECCQLKCGPCNICLTCFDCSCHDYSLNCTICYHIHAVVNYQKRGEVFSDSLTSDLEVSRHLETVSITTGSQVKSVENAEVVIKNQIQAGVNKFMETLSANHNIDLLKEMLKHVNVLVAMQSSSVSNVFDNENESNRTVVESVVAEEIAEKALESTQANKRYVSVENVPINPKIRKLNPTPTGSKSDAWNKKIKPQARFYSTKKKRTAKKPTDGAEPLRPKLFKPEKDIFISTSRSNDHKYTLPEENDSAYIQINN